MADDGRELDGLSLDEQELAHRLTDLGEFMRELQRAGSDVDPTFARTLRAHLLHGEELAPHPTFARRLRRRLTRRTGARSIPRPRPRRLRSPFWLGVLTAIAGIIATVFITLPHGAGFHTPYPTRADLLFNVPAKETTSTRLAPTLSLVHPASGVAYTGPLQLGAARLPQSPSTVHAYRLAILPDVAARARRLLAIHSPIRRTVIGKSVWLVAADGGTARRPLHSLAVSRTTGELIYHDRRNFRLPPARHALSRSLAIGAARQWLTRLGWPGQRLSLRSFGRVPTLPKLRLIILGWSGVGQATIQEATLWVAPDHSIIEAWIWPPVAQSGTVAARSTLEAWTDVTAGKVPFFIRGVQSAARTVARATLHRATMVLILLPGTHGAPYLVPAYRFEGTVRLGASEKRAWLSLAPGIPK